MRTKALLVVAAVGLCAEPAQAQDFLNALARQAAGAVVQKAVSNAVSGEAPAPVPPTPVPGPAHIRPTGIPPTALKPPIKPPVKPAPADLEGLTEAQREQACNRRVPLDADGGRSYEKQLAFGKCMGPKYGEGG